MLTTGVAALCGLIAGWGIRSMRQTPTAQQGASGGLLGRVGKVILTDESDVQGDCPKTLAQIQVWCKQMTDLGFCPDHYGEYLLTIECSLHPFHKLALLMDLAVVQAECPKCCHKVFLQETG